MNRVKLDDVRYIDLDEFISMEIVPIQFIDDKDGVKTVKDGFRVDGITKQGLRVDSLCIDKQSGKDLACRNFVMANWVNAKK